MQDLLPPYLDTLTQKLLALLQNGQKLVQEGALTAMASVADCAKNHFVSYYGQAGSPSTVISEALRPALAQIMSDLSGNHVVERGTRNDGCR